MKRRWPATLLNAVLGLAIVAVILLSLYKLRIALHDFDTVEITARQSEDVAGKGERLDDILLENIESFKHIHSFDHLFKKPAHEYRLNTVWLDRCEVRQGDFYKFAKWSEKHPTKIIAAPDQPPNWTYQSSSSKHKISGRLKAPANGVSYYDAYAYCKSGGGRLPDRLEWLAIASGEEQRLYPWGDTFVADGWPYLDPRLNAAQACGLRSSKSQKIHNVGDVVSEWAAGNVADPRPSLHGGNAYNKPFEIYSLAGFYRYAPAKYRSPYVGFRCVYDRQPDALPWTGQRPSVERISSAKHRIGLPEETKIPGLLANLPKEKVGVIKILFSHKQRNKNFRILRHEVTRAQYGKFLRDPLVRLGIYANAKEPETHDYRPDTWDDGLSEQDALAITDVDWWSAWAFANWAGGRLPSAEEWMLASSDGGKHVYPWGNEFKENHAVTADDRHTSQQLSTPDGKDQTHTGIYDMGGNVSEWTRSLVAAGNHYAAIVKGGNYSLPGKDAAKFDFENQVPLSLRSPHIGFRIVFDAED